MALTAADRHVVASKHLVTGRFTLPMISAMALPFGLYTSSEILAIAPLAWAMLLLLTRRKALWASFAVGALLCARRWTTASVRCGRPTTCG